MLQSYLRKHADKLDEKNYRVAIKNDFDYTANKSFQDSDYDAGPWLKDIWRRLFQIKLERIGVSIFPESRVLDVCCGQGYLGETIEKEFGGEVFYCDLSLFQLTTLLKRREFDTNKPAVCAANLLRLPYPSETFDLVIGNSFLHHLPDVPSALHELARVLKRKGVIVLLHEPNLNAIFWESFPLSLIKDTTPTEGSFTDLWMFKPEDLERLLDWAGFGSIRVLESGVLSAILINWYMILTIKLNLSSRFLVYPAYMLRFYLTKIDLAFQNGYKRFRSPSLMVVGRKLAELD